MGILPQSSLVSKQSGHVKRGTAPRNCPDSKEALANLGRQLIVHPGKGRGKGKSKEPPREGPHVENRCERTTGVHSTEIT